ncbi:MAG: hypothetical protein QM723_08535 [Myxococcaceae bacterium]
MLLALLLAAAPVPDNADAEVQRAVELYRSFKVAEGIKVLSRALTRTTLSPAQRARVYVYVGIGEANRGDDAASRRALEQALAYDANVELPDIASPKTRSVFEQLQPKAPPPASTPPPAELTPKPVAPEPVAVEPAPPPVVETHHSRWWLVPAVATVAAGVAGGVLLGESESRYQTLQTGTGITLTRQQSLVSEGKTFQSGAWVALACAGVALALTALLAFVIE